MTSGWDVKTVGKKRNTHLSTDKQDVTKEPWGFVAVIDCPSVDSTFLQQNWGGTIFTSAVSCFYYITRNVLQVTRVQYYMNVPSEFNSRLYSF